MAGLKEKKNRLEAALADAATYSDKNKFLETETSYKNVCEELADLNNRFEKVFENIIKLESRS
jgi:ATP-binding cassette subfamily F protein 3